MTCITCSVQSTKSRYHYDYLSLKYDLVNKCHALLSSSGKYSSSRPPPRPGFHFLQLELRMANGSRWSSYWLSSGGPRKPNSPSQCPRPPPHFLSPPRLLSPHVTASSRRVSTIKWDILKEHIHLTFITVPCYNCSIITYCSSLTMPNL